MDLAGLRNVKSEVAAVTIILCADMAFLIAAFSNREKFLWFEFHGLVGVIEIVVLLISLRLLGIYGLRQAAADMHESMRLLEQRAARSESVAAEAIEALSSLQDQVRQLLQSQEDKDR